MHGSSLLNDLETGPAGADLSARLSAWAVEAGSEFPHIARKRAADAFVDVIGCMIAGSTHPSTLAVLEASRTLGEGTVPVIMSQRCVAAPWAAMAGGTAAHALDFDDNFAPSFTHATAVTAPALLALAGELEVTGAQLIDAYIVGLELQARLSSIFNPDHYGRGWHATSTVGAIGTAGACARLLGLGAKGVQAALSIASSMAGGAKIQFGSPMKPVHAGLAAKAGVVAARLAQAGLTGNLEPFIGPLGMQAVFTGYPEGEGVERALEDLGQSIALAREGLLVKRFPCCGAAHKTLDGIAELRLRHAIAPETVASVITIVPAIYRQNLRFDQPRTEAEARFSLTYCAARTLVNGALKLEDMTTAGVNEAGFERWLDLIEIELTPDGGGIDAPIETRIVLKDGTSFKTVQSKAVGSATKPLSAIDLERKFQDCCAWAGQDSGSLYALATSLADAESVAGVYTRICKSTSLYACNENVLV